MTSNVKVKEKEKKNSSEKIAVDFYYNPKFRRYHSLNHGPGSINVKVKF